MFKKFDKEPKLKEPLKKTNKPNTRQILEEAEDILLEDNESTQYIEEDDGHFDDSD